MSKAKENREHIGWWYPERQEFSKTDKRQERAIPVFAIEETKGNEQQPTSGESIEKITKEFIIDLQWELRDSYNSSSCLNSKQREFLKNKLEDLLSAQLDTSEATVKDLLEANEDGLKELQRLTLRLNTSEADYAIKKMQDVRAKAKKEG